MANPGINVVQLLYVLFGVIAFETIILIYVLMKTPAITFMRCMLLNRRLVIEKFRGGPFYAFKAGKQDGKTCIEVKGKPKCRYFITPDSLMIWDKGKIGTYFVPSNTTFTSNFDFQAILIVLEKKMGKPIKNHEELMTALATIKAREPEYAVKLAPYKTVKLRDLDRYYPSYMNTEDVEAKIQALAKKESLLNKLNPQTVMLMVIVLIAGAIAYTIITKNQTPNITVLVQNGTSAISQAVQPVSGGGIGFLNSTMGSVLG